MATPIPLNRAAFTVEGAAAATRGVVVRRGASASAVAVGVTTDSRAVAKGGIFVALKGESHDGHAFVGGAVERGAAIVIVERGRGRATEVVAESASVIEVEDTLVALGELAREHLEAWRAGRSGTGTGTGTGAYEKRVVAVTGSAGKTTTKELVAALLGAVGETHRTAGNLNNRVGVPSVVLGIEQERFAVLEMGMSLPGELDAITAFARPDVAIVTNVGIAHAEGVGGPEGVMREKGAVYRALDEHGIAIVNADDALATQAAEGTRARVRLTFGNASDANYRLAERDPDPAGGSRVVIVCERASLGLALRVLSLRLPLPGEAAAIDLTAALAAQEAASGVELSAEAIEAALANVVLAGRATVTHLGSDIVVLDDTYNANPASMRAALATLGELAGTERRRVAILGEMKELGAHAETEHDALGEVLAKSGVVLAIGCGGLVDRSLARASKAGPFVEVVMAGSTEEAAREAVRRVRPGDAVLVKGSRSVGAERVVAALSEAWPGGSKSAWSSGGVSRADAPGTPGEPQE